MMPARSAAVSRSSARLGHALVLVALLTAGGTPCTGQGLSAAGGGAAGTRMMRPAGQPAERSARQTIRLSLADGLTRITASARVTYGGARFLLKIGDRAFGPFSYEDMTVADLGAYGPYELKPGKEGGFSFKAMIDSQVYGPFAFRDGAQVPLGTNTFALAIVPFEIRGAIRGRRAAPGGIPVSLIKVTPEMLKDAVRMRSEFRSFEREAAARTAPRRVPGPTVSGMGRDRSPWVEPSRHDRLRSADTAGRKAAAALDQFIRKHRLRYVNPTGSGEFVFAGLDPAAYVVCATGMLTGGSREERSARQVVWWANVSQGGGSAEVEFNEQNAYACKALFLPW